MKMFVYSYELSVVELSCYLQEGEKYSCVCIIFEVVRPRMKRRFWTCYMRNIIENAVGNGIEKGCKLPRSGEKRCVNRRGERASPVAYSLSKFPN